MSLAKSAGIALLTLTVIGFVMLKVLIPQGSEASNSEGEENYWIGVTNADWSNETNWSLGRAPRHSDKVILHASRSKEHAVHIPEGSSYEISSLDISGCQLVVEGNLSTSGFIQLRSKKSELSVSGSLECNKYLAALTDALLKFKGTVRVAENFLVENAIVVQEQGSLVVMGDVELRRQGSVVRVEGGDGIVKGDLIAYQSQNEVNRLKVTGGTFNVKGTTVFQKSKDIDNIPASLWIDGGRLELNEVSRGRNMEGHQDGVYNFRVSSGHAVFNKNLMLDTLKEGDEAVVRMFEGASLWNANSQYNRMDADDIVKVRYRGWVYTLSHRYWASKNERPDTSSKWIELGKADDEDKTYNLSLVAEWNTSRVYKRTDIDDDVYVQHKGLIYRMSKTCNLSKSNVPSENKWAWILWYEPRDEQNFSDVFVAEGGHISFQQDFEHWSGFKTYGDNTIALNGDESSYSLKNGDEYHSIEIGGDALVSVPGTVKVTGDILFSSQRPVEGTGTLTLVGNGIQRIRNTSPLQIKHLAIAKDSGEVRLKGRLHIEDRLSWTALVPIVAEMSALKLEHANSTVLSFGTNVSIIGEGWFEGPIEKVGLAAFSFPTGKNGKKAPISISKSTDTSRYRAEYFAYDVPAYKSKTSELSCVSQMEYWSLKQLGRRSTSKITLHWTNGNWSQINDVADLVVAEFDGQKWKSMGQNSYTGSALSGAITSQNSMASARYYTYGSTSNVNPLSQDAAPIQAERQNNKVEFYASQLPDRTFVKEAQLCGDSTFAEFETAWVAKNNELYAIDLAHTDVGNMLFLRLLLVDMESGVEKYSAISQVTQKKSGSVEVLSLYPNPVISETRLSLQSAGAQKGTVRIVDLRGRMLKQESLDIEKGRNEVLLSGLDGFVKGQYQVLIELNGHTQTIPFIKT